MALLAHARSMPADGRARLASEWSAAAPPGSVLLSTCHRVELYGSGAALTRLAASAAGGVRVVDGADVARQLVTLAVGRDSTVLGEDQILHQLRLAVQAARRRATVTSELDRLFDLCLQAGRRARSWLPASRPTLVDVALERAVGERDLSGAAIHVVGSGEMGRRALLSLIRRRASLTISSRTRDSARALGISHGVADLDFDPGSEHLSRATGVLVAVAGPWRLSVASQRALVESGAWLIDLSSPSAVDPQLAAQVGDRLLTIDDLTAAPGRSASARTLARLDALIDETVAAYQRWAGDQTQRAAADALARRARELRAAELDQLWRRVPSLDDGQRTEVARAVEHLTERLLRDPLEQLSRDRDGRQARAARELFRL